MKEYEIINPNRDETAQAVKANYGRMSYANAVHTDTRKATFIMERETILVNGNKDGLPRAVRATYGKTKTSAALCDYNSKPTLIMEKAEPQVLRMERTEEEKRRRHAEGDKGAKFSAAKEMKPRQDGITNTLTSSTNDNLVCEKWRIRKLTPRECGKLMDCDDETIDKMVAAGIPKTQLYKLFGNSIYVAPLYGIFYQLFIDQSNKSKQQTLF